MRYNILKIILKIDYKNNYKVISTNRMYFCNRSRQVVSPDYKKFRSRFSQVSPEVPTELKEFINKGEFKNLRSEFHVIWYTDLKFKNGELIRKDSSNILKPLEDTISEWSKLDDKFNMKVSVVKYQRESDYDSVLVTWILLDPVDHTISDTEYELSIIL